MFKVLIVDDEAWVVKSLQMAINWNDYGFEVVGSASDGVEALAQIEELKPSLVVTDIRMPVMGGLELMEKARARWPSLQFIIVSVHAEFEYARKAIDCGAAGYCLKPADEQEMAKMLQVVKSRIEAQLSSGADIFMVLEETNDRAEILRCFAERGIQWDDRGMKVVCGSLPGKTTLQKKSDLYLVSKAEVPALPCLTVGTSRGVSADVEDPFRISEAVVEAQIASKQYFITGKPGTYEYSTRSRAMLRERIAAVTAAASVMNARQVHQELEAVLVELQSGGYNIKHAYQTYIRLCDVLDMQHSGNHDYELESYRELAQSFPNVQAMIRFLQDQFFNQISLPPDSGPAANVVQNIISYLNKNYASEITLSGLSAQFHLNPSYLCRIFKRECGKTLTGYLVEVRLQKACQMLRCTCLPVSQIAKKCGYEDYFYFARLFKRTLRVTPTQYREGVPVNEANPADIEDIL